MYYLEKKLFLLYIYIDMFYNGGWIDII
jgi:hypothetical protein